MKMTKPEQDDAGGKPKTATVTDLDAVRRSRQSVLSDDSSGETGREAPEPARTDKKARRVSNRRFDTEKVERLKAEIAAGQYRIDHERVASKFIEYDPH